MASVDFTGLVSRRVAHPNNMVKKEQVVEEATISTIALSDHDSVMTSDTNNGSNSPSYPCGLSAADIFYAQMNGETLSSNPPRETSSTHEVVIQDLNKLLIEEMWDGDDDELTTDDDCSFADLEFPSTETTTSSSSSCSVSAMSNLTERQVMTIEELGNNLLQHLPNEVKENIPDHVWEKIFKRSSLVETNKIAQKKKTSILKRPSTGQTEANETLATTPPEPLIKFSVQFSTVQVRYYERTIDNNPSVTSGPAIGLGWRYNRARKVSVDDWELQRSFEDRLSLSPTVLSRTDREELLKYWGFSPKDIAIATRNILKAKSARRVTVQNLDCQSMEEAVEKTARCVKGLLRGRFRGAKAA